MLTWLFVAVSVLAVAALVWRLLGANVLGRNQGWSDFEHFVRSLLVLMEDGGVLTVHGRGVDVDLRFRRISSDGDAALIRLEIPRANWSEAALSTLREEFREQKVPAGNTEYSQGPPPLLAIDIPVADIWSDDAGAEGARLAHLVLSAACISSDVRFDFDFVGTRSDRMTRRYRRLRAERRAEGIRSI